MKVPVLPLLLQLLIGFSLSSPVRAEVSFEEVSSKALSERPLVKEITARIESMRAEGVDASTLDNPNLDAEIRFPTSYEDQRGDNEIEVSLSQPLRISQFSARSRINDLIQQTANYDEQVALIELNEKLRLSFSRAWAIEARIETYSKIKKRAEYLEGLVKKGAGGGLYTDSEAKLFRAESLKLSLQKKLLASQSIKTRSELSKQAGFSVEGRLLKPKLAPPPPLESLLDSEEFLPIQRRAQLHLKLAEEQARLSRLDAYPKFEPRVVYERTNEGSDFVGAGISFELPFFDRNQAERSKRAAELESARSSGRYLTGESFKAQVEALREALLSSMELLAEYEKGILPALEEAVKGQEALLSEGRGSPFQVWQVHRELLDNEEEAIELMLQTQAERTELIAMTGVEF